MSQYLIAGVCGFCIVTLDFSVGLASTIIVTATVVRLWYRRGSALGVQYSICTSAFSLFSILNQKRCGPLINTPTSHTLSRPVPVFVRRNPLGMQHALPILPKAIFLGRVRYLTASCLIPDETITAFPSESVCCSPRHVGSGSDYPQTL